MELMLTLDGTIVNIINGAFAFWIMRWAHKVVEDPEFEKRMWKRWDDKKLLRK
jgi:hypothetical protein